MYILNLIYKITTNVKGNLKTINISIKLELKNGTYAIKLFKNNLCIN